MSDNIPSKINYELYWAAVHLRDFIEMQPINNPLIWCGDSKRKVIDMPHYKKAIEAIRSFESHFDIKAMNTRKLVDAAH